MSLAARGLTVRYGARVALDVPALALAPGDLIGLVGPNGAGKSTLLKALAGLVARSGTVTWRGAPIESLGAQQRARSIAYVPQTPPVHWPLPVRELVALGRLPHRGHAAAATAADDEATEWALRETRTTVLAERSVAELSMGERARVVLARALAVRAPVMLLDEPIAMLDPYHQLEIMQLLRRYVTGACTEPAIVVVVLHNLTLAARFCTRVLLMDRCTVVADGAPPSALDEAAIRRHYRVAPFVAAHDGATVIVPWAAIDEASSDHAAR
jgi:iron complex transport system ATP-binding protein